MRIRTKYILFIGFLHLVTLVLSFYVFKENKLLFLGAELLIILSIVLSWQLYKELIQPLKLLMTGIDALESQDFNVKFLPTGKYEIDQLIEVYNKMIDQLRTERVQQEQQHFFLENLIQTSPTGILVLDYDNRIAQVNPKALQLLDVQEQDIKGKEIHQLDHPFLKQVSGLPSGASKTISISGVDTYKVQAAHFIDRGFPRHFLMIEDLTAEILEAEKKVYGKVIRMMAHEVNNTVGPVNSIINSTLRNKALWEEQSDSPLREALQVAIDRNENLNAFMRGFADLVKLPMPSRGPVDMNRLLSDVAQLMKGPAAERNIRFVMDLDLSNPILFADQQQMEQVIINVVKNGIEAIEYNGTITFRSNARAHTLSISDTGKGIDKKQKEQLFSPFFSTKRNGQGLGLTLVREILMNHQFSFSLDSVEGETVFEISW
jgi:two-component system, NtrC family, nitrogen regulation sensor histidine kinase NtrY